MYATLRRPYKLRLALSVARSVMLPDSVRCHMAVIDTPTPRSRVVLSVIMRTLRARLPLHPPDSDTQGITDCYARYSIRKLFESHITLMALAGLACACLFQAFIFIKEILMTIACPVCKSLHIKTLDRGRDAGTVIGATGGAAAGLMAAVGGAETGAALGAVAGPVGIAVGGLTGALLGGLFGAAAGGAAGRAVGTAVDERLLENLECQHCGLQFSGRDLD